MFLDEDYEFLLSRNGKEGLDRFKIEDNIKLVLLDYNMPEMNGLQVTQEMRAISKEVKIIMMSGNHDIKNKALSFGVNRFIEKPMELDIKELVLEELKENNGGENEEN